LDGQQEFLQGYLSADVLSWVPSADLAADGQRLFGTLLTDGVLRSAWDQACGRSTQRRIRLRIDPNAPELHALPWELLREGDTMLSADATTPFSRYLPVSKPWGGAVKKRPIRVLAMISNPDDLEKWPALAPLDVELERSILEQAFSGLGELGKSEIQLDFLDAPATLERLETALHRGYHALHYLGHGGFDKKKQQALLYMQDKEGNTRGVREEKFAGMLSRQRAGPPLVFLAACQSATRSTTNAFLGLGPKLVAVGVPAVVAMQDRVGIETARDLSRIFYQRLAEHGIVDCAMSEARSVLLTVGRPDAAVPVLFMRLKSGQLWDVAQVYMDDIKLFEPETVHVPAGSFLMGSPAGEGVPDWETPQHEVTLPAYRIGKYPVTNAQYAEFLKREQTQDAPRKVGWFLREPPAEQLDHPVVGVSWYDAQAYCRWLSVQTGRRYRLPTEAEWEKAARGIEGRLYPWGNEWEEGRCHARGDDTAPVAAYPQGASPYGCCDMAGNVQEWVSTLWGNDREPFLYPYRDDDGRQDLQADAYLYRVRRVHRGGSFRDERPRLRCAARGYSNASSQVRWRGFRVVLDI
jgi:formylglycine-generating enzyme required for sulfatase activity